MRQLASNGMLQVTEPQRFLRRMLFRLRWATIAIVLLITVVMPTPSLVRVPTWVLMLGFAAYSLVGDLVKMRLPGPRALAWGAILDLPAAALLYFLGGETGGPLFVLFVLAVDCAAASLTVQHTVIFTGVVALVAASIDGLLRAFVLSQMDLRLVGARVIMLVLIGLGMAIVSRRLLLEQALTQAVQSSAERLEQLDRIRTDFVANVSHELRTPLTATRAGLGLLEASTLDRLRPDEVHLLANARRNIERLNVLIDDLLANNQLEAGTLVLAMAQLDFRAVVMRALTAVHPLIVEKQQVLEIDLSEPLVLEGDAFRLEQLVVNVLSNAHRHTPPGTHIGIGGNVVDGNIVFSIRDDGPSIPATEIDNIFQRFHHLTSADSSSGLGLAIARAIVEIHRGRIWAENDYPQGKVFWVVLPVVHAGGTR